MVTLLTARSRRKPEPASVPVGPVLSIYDPVFIGIDQFGKHKYVTPMYKNVLLAGEPRSGKSTMLSNFIAPAALSMDCRLCLIDGKQVELGLWDDAADVFIGPDVDAANRTLARLQI